MLRRTGGLMINDYTVSVIESIFSEMRRNSFDEICDASDYLYNHVKNEGIYPQQVVDGFYSAREIILELTSEQFLILKSFLSS